MQRTNQGSEYPNFTRVLLGLFPWLQGHLFPSIINSIFRFICPDMFGRWSWFFWDFVMSCCRDFYIWSVTHFMWGVGYFFYVSRSGTSGVQCFFREKIIFFLSLLSLCGFFSTGVICILLQVWHIVMVHMNTLHKRAWKVLCWNVRGINSDSKWDSIINKITERRCDIICLQETKKMYVDL